MGYSAYGISNFRRLREAVNARDHQVRWHSVRPIHTGTGTAMITQASVLYFLKETRGQPLQTH